MCHSHVVIKRQFLQFIFFISLLAGIQMWNKRPPCWNSTFGFDFSSVLFCISNSNYGKTNFIYMGTSTPEIWRHIAFSSWGNCVANILPTSGLVTSHIWEDSKLFLFQILTRYLNLRLRYNYFRFWKQTTVILRFHCSFRF